MKSRILVGYGKTTEIAKKVGCKPQHVRLSLRGAYDSKLSEKIRKTALRMGGVLVNDTNK